MQTANQSLLKKTSKNFIYLFTILYFCFVYLQAVKSYDNIAQTYSSKNLFLMYQNINFGTVYFHLRIEVTRYLFYT